MTEADLDRAALNLAEILFPKQRIIGSGLWERDSMKLLLILASLGLGSAAVIKTVELMHNATAVMEQYGH